MVGEQLNILFLCADSGIPFWGVKGGSIHMREIVSCFSSKNCNVTVVAEDSSDGSAESGGDSAYNIPDARAEKFFPYLNDLFGNDRIRSEFEDFLRNSEMEILLNSIHSKKGIDIVYERYSLFNVSGLSFCRKQGIPHVLEVNSPLIEEAAKYRNLALPGIAAAVEDYLFSNTDHIIAVSNELKEFIWRKYPDSRVTVVPNGVRVDHFSFEGFRSDSDVNNKFVIGFLGSLKPWHGVEILIDSFAGIADNDDSSRLLIIGDNKKTGSRLARRCENLKIDGKVEFTGAVEYDRIPEMLHQTDVLVAPYPRMDNFYFSSLKIFEYMAAGKAIIASNIGQISAVLTHEKTALLVPPGDPMALRRALERLKDDPDLRRRLGDRARIEARTRHTWSQRADKILDVISELKAGELQT
jgi:glycosyltransferase involved in cell wall biosynthesis